jgi:hypothetical protein
MLIKGQKKLARGVLEKVCNKSLLFMNYNNRARLGVFNNIQHHFKYINNFDKIENGQL